MTTLPAFLGPFTPIVPAPVPVGYGRDFFAPIDGGAPPKIVDEFTLQYQENDNWCWAATAASINDCYNKINDTPEKKVIQSKIVAQGLDLPYCVEQPDNPDCNQSSDLGRALHRLDRLAAKKDSPLDLTSNNNGSSIQEEIDNKRPIGCLIHWPGKPDGHCVVIYGYDLDNKDIYVADPLKENNIYGFYSYSKLKSNYFDAGGTWSKSYLTNASGDSADGA
jgi:hypothetical protein